MSDARFEGRIDQAAAGNVINKGPQLNNSNVVNLHLHGQAGEQQSPEEYLTPQQKGVIGQLVEKIVAATEAEPLEVWNQVLARTGSKKVKFIPKHCYVELEEYLRNWLSKAVASSAPPQVKPAQPAPVTPPPNPPVPERQRLVSCAHCDATRKIVSKARKAMFGALMTAGVAITALAYIGLKAYLLAGTLQATEARLKVCEFAGKAYTIGSIMEQKNAADVECSVVVTGSAPQWRLATSGAHAERKTLRLKNHVHDRGLN